MQRLRAIATWCCFGNSWRE